MISPFSSTCPFSHYVDQSRLAISHAYTRCSACVTKIIAFVKSFFQNLAEKVKKIFIKDTPPPQTKNFTPEVSPKSLSSSDPFFKEIFLTSGQHRYEFALEDVHALFNHLGGHGYTHWITHALSIQSLEGKLNNYNLPPLVFLYLVTCNQPMTAYVCNFRKEVKSKSWLLLGRKPWQEFIHKQAVKFMGQNKDISLQLPGFAKALGLKELPSYPKTLKEWEDFVQFVLEKRKDHFKL